MRSANTRWNRRSRWARPKLQPLTRSPQLGTPLEIENDTATLPRDFAPPSDIGKSGAPARSPEGRPLLFFPLHHPHPTQLPPTHFTPRLRFSTTDRHTRNAKIKCPLKPHDPRESYGLLRGESPYVPGTHRRDRRRPNHGRRYCPVHQFRHRRTHSRCTQKRIRVGIIGCGSVSGVYLPHLVNCPYADVVSTCDIIPERAERRAKEHNIANHYPHIDQMLAGVDFDLLVNTTDMQEHEHLNREAIAAGKHIWSEKPIANSLAAGQAIVQQAKDKGVRIWGAPVVVSSPQFAFMARALAAGKLGRVASAHADYGHTGPTWSSFFYEKGGGSMPDLGVYNLTSLTGLLGPALGDRNAQRRYSNAQDRSQR